MGSLRDIKKRPECYGTIYIPDKCEGCSSQEACRKKIFLRAHENWKVSIKRAKEAMSKWEK